MHIVVLTGAGISAESGIPTFRGAGGLWEGFRIEDVASPEGWQRDPAGVLAFYNARRRTIREAQPNAAHHALAALEKKMLVDIITQNIDDLHERAGSARVLHLHGEIFKARSTKDPTLVFPCPDDLHQGDLCPLGSQLRPHIVWFGEEVPMMQKAAEITSHADILLVVGTSLVVYPAASLLLYAGKHIPIFIVNPEKPDFVPRGNIRYLQQPATTGVPEAIDKIVAGVF